MRPEVTEVRSYAVALWLYSKGHEPIEAGFTPGGSLVFVFSPEVAQDIESYHEAKAVFNGLEARARLLARARGQRVRPSVTVSR